jgi:DtxR family Mn-dependent transcriptional regulator
MTQTAQYLLTLYIAEHQLSPPIPTGRVAEMLGRSASTATETIQRLDDQGLVTYEPYGGATLTDSGRQRARELHETYVALSWFFREVLDLETHEREAMEMADPVSPAVADRLVELLVERGAADERPVSVPQES